MKVNLNNLRQDSNTADALFVVIEQIFKVSKSEFRRTGQRYTYRHASGLVIAKHRISNQWCIFNYSDKAKDSTGIPTGYNADIFKTLKDYLYQDNKEFINLCKHVADAANLLWDRYSNEAVATKTAQAVKKTPVEVIPFTPNTIGNHKIYFKHQSSESPLYVEVVAEYFARFGVTPETLDKYQVTPLGRYYGISKKGHKVNFSYTATRPAVIWKAGNNIKFKPITGKAKGFALQYDGNYLFGYDQLPPTAEALIFTEGEKDTIVLNHHLNKFGIYAVTRGGATSSIPALLLEELQTRFKKIAVMFDNDSTGQVSMGKHQGKLQIINIADIVNDNNKFKDCEFTEDINTTLNDIADIAEYDVNLLINIVQNQLIKTTIPKDPDNSFSVNIPHVYNVDIQDYIGEKIANPLTNKTPIESIADVVNLHQRTYIKSNTGSGKTWMLADFVKGIYGQIDNITFTIIAQPTVVLVNQTAQDFASKGIDVEVVDGGRTDYDYIMALKPELIVTTWDSLIKIDFLVHGAMLVIDEAGQMPLDASYRARAINKCFDLIPYASKTLFLSATPNYLHCAHSAKIDSYLYDFKLININQKNTQTFTVSPYLVNSKKEILNIIQYHKNQFEDGLHLIKFDNVEVLEAYATQVDATIFSSQAKKYNEDNPHFNSIVNTGKTDGDVDYILSTSVITSGLSIRQKVDSVSFVGATNAADIMQLMSRPRKAHNQNVKALLFNIGKQTDIEQYQRDLIVNGTPVEEIHQRQLELAEDIAGLVNKNPDYGVTRNLLKLHKINSIRFSETQGKYVVNHASILHAIERNKQIQIGYAGMLKELQRIHPNVSITEPQFLNAPDDSNTIDAYSDRMQAKEDRQNKIKEVLQQSPVEFLNTCYHLTSSVSLKKRIASIINVTSDPKHIALFDGYYEDILKRLLYLDIKKKKYNTKLNFITLEDAAKVVINSPVKSVQIQDTIKTQAALAAYSIIKKHPQQAKEKLEKAGLVAITGADQYKAEKLIAYKTTIDKLRKKASRKGAQLQMDKTEMSGQLDISEKTVLKVMKALYDIKYDQNDKLWTISKPKSLTSALEDASDLIKSMYQNPLEKTTPILEHKNSSNH